MVKQQLVSHRWRLFKYHSCWGQFFCCLLFCFIFFPSGRGLCVQCYHYPPVLNGRQTDNIDIKTISWAECRTLLQNEMLFYIWILLLLPPPLFFSSKSLSWLWIFRWAVMWLHCTITCVHGGGKGTEERQSQTSLELIWGLFSVFFPPSL